MILDKPHKNAVAELSRSHMQLSVAAGQLHVVGLTFPEYAEQCQKLLESLRTLQNEILGIVRQIQGS